jgi:hypothetical protein
MKNNACCLSCLENGRTLSAGINLKDLANALTDPEKRFEFPIKPMKTEIDLSTPTKLVIIALGASIVLASIIRISNPTK